MYHSCQKLDIHNAGELSWFLQVIEAILFHQLSNDLISDLRREGSYILRLEEQWRFNVC